MSSSLIPTTLRRLSATSSSRCYLTKGVNSFFLPTKIHHSIHRARACFSSSPNVSSSSEDTITVTIDQARSTTAMALEKIGWDAHDAALQAEIMTAAELCGNNQGLVKMYQPTMMQPAPNSGKPSIERETNNSAVLNANQAPGMLAAVMGADKAVELCRDKKNTVAIVCTHNTSTSSGQLGYYVERIARQGLIGICMANSPEMVAAAKGGKPVFGTNPLAVGIPQAGPYPFIVSYSCCVVLRCWKLTNLT